MKRRITGLFLGGALFLGCAVGVNAAQEAIKTDTLGEKLKAKSISLSGKGSLGSLISESTFINNDGSYNPATIQKVKEAIRQINYNSLKGASNYLSSNKEGLMYKNKLSAAVAEAEKIKEEMNKGEEQKPTEKTEEEEKQPEITPEKGETEETPEKPETGESSEEQVKLNEYTTNINGVTATIYYDDAGSIIKVKSVGDGWENEWQWGQLDDQSQQAATEALNNYLHPSSSEEQKPSQADLEAITNYKEYTENGVTIRVIYNDNNEITNVAIIQDGKWEVIQEWEQMSGSAQEDVLTHLEKYYGGQSEEQEIKISEYAFEENGISYKIYYTDDGTITDALLNVEGTEMTWELMGETEKEYLADKLNNYLNSGKHDIGEPEQSQEEQKTEETKEKITIDLRPYLQTIDENQAKSQKLKAQMNKLEAQIQRLNEEQQDAVAFNDWERLDELEQQVYDLQDRYYDLENEWQGCINAMENAESEINVKENEGDRYAGEGYEVEYLRDYTVTENSSTENSPTLELPENIPSGGTVDEIPDELESETELEGPANEVGNEVAL